MGNKKKQRQQMKIPNPYEGVGQIGLSDSANVQPTDYPVFSFRNIVKEYSVDKCNAEEKCRLLEKIDMMSQNTWDGLMIGSHWSGSGFEKIPKSQIKGTLPSSVTEDVSKLYVMRFNGRSARLIGYRSGHVFHITHIDTKCTAYKH